MSEIAVIIPTFRRPDSLARALDSVLAQTGGGLIGEIAVVDNDPGASARPAVQHIQTTDERVRYIHCPDPGVSNARNAGLAATSAPLIAWLDDDEEAPPHWIAALYAAHKNLSADVTFGPVRGRADAAATWKRAYLDAFFSRTGPAETGITEEVHGCGNAMMTRATALAAAMPFDVRANETGGEDDRLFQHLTAEGRRFTWAAEAWVWEHAPESRQTARYALSRAFGYGQTPAQIAARDGSSVGVLKWMVVGAAQAALFGLIALCLSPFSLKRALPLADRAARGLGKVIWFKRLRFYGAAAANKQITCHPGKREAVIRDPASGTVGAAGSRTAATPLPG